jgi:aldose 1-epimerase
MRKIMSKYSLEKGTFGKYPTVILKNNSNNEKLEIALRGATTLSYFIDFYGNPLKIIDGFESPEEMEQSTGAKGWVMAPFANRIRNRKYSFNGKDFELDSNFPGNEVMHGLLSNVNYDLYKTDITQNSIEAVFVCKKIRPGVFKGYPFSLDVYVKYKLVNDELYVSITGENVGDEPLPFNCGWHPYFKTSENGIDHLIMTLNAAKIILLAKDMTPIDGEEAYESIEKHSDFDFRISRHFDERSLKNKILDNGFCDLVIDKDGYSRTSIYDPKNKLEIILFQRGGITLVYTGDTLPKNRRKAVAIEPMQFLTNAFNRLELKEKIKVLPGKNSTFEFGVEIKQR